MIFLEFWWPAPKKAQSKLVARSFDSNHCPTMQSLTAKCSQGTTQSFGNAHLIVTIQNFTGKTWKDNSWSRTPEVQMGHSSTTSVWVQAEKKVSQIEPIFISILKANRESSSRVTSFSWASKLSTTQRKVFPHKINLFLQFPIKSPVDVSLALCAFSMSVAKNARDEPKTTTSHSQSAMTSKSRSTTHLCAMTNSSSLTSTSKSPNSVKM